MIYFNQSQKRILLAGKFKIQIWSKFRPRQRLFVGVYQAKTFRIHVSMVCRLFSSHAGQIWGGVTGPTMGSYGFLWVPMVQLEPGWTWIDPDGPGCTWTDLDWPGRTWTDLDGSGRTRTYLNGPRRTWTDPDRPGVLIRSKRFFQTLELMTVEYALAT